MICEKKIEFPKWEESNNACVVDYCSHIMNIARRNSCGKSLLCREGTLQVYEIINYIAAGNGRSDDVLLICEILEQILKHESCQMARDAASVCLNLIKSYEDEWDKHVRRKICSNAVCKELKAPSIKESSEDQEGQGMRRRRRK